MWVQVKEITINKSVTIKGIGDEARLNANSKSRVFHIKADNVILENLVIFKGYDYDGGAGIYNEANNLKIINCRFLNNNVDLYGAGLLSEGNNVTIMDCQFSSNTAKYTGGAFQLDGDDNYVDNCVFYRNVGGHVGGAVAWVGNNGTLTNSIFTDSGYSVASQHGGAVVWIGANGILTRSTFTNNNVKKSGAAVYWRWENGSLNYCIFKDNAGDTDNAYWGNPEYAYYNYWGLNINDDENFTGLKLMYYNQSCKSPQNWVNIESTDNYVRFILNNGSELTEYLPDYPLTSQITIKNNYHVFKKNVNLLCSNMVAYAANTKTCQILLKDENNNKLSSKKLQITLNNKVYSVSTDKNGIAKLNINLKNSGSYNLKISFNGDNYYNSAGKVVKITVKKQKVKLTVKKYKKSIKITLKDQFKKAISKQKIKITIIKKTYVKKTNKKGVVSFNLKGKNRYNATIKYAGSKTYAGISKKVIIR